MEYDISDNELIYLYRSNNIMAIELLMDRYKKRIYGLIEKLKKHYNMRKIDFRDFYHTCCIAFIKCIEKFDDEYMFYSYAIRSIENVVLREIQKEIKYDYIENIDHELIVKGIYEDTYISDVSYMYEENTINDYLKSNLDELSLEIIRYRLEGYTIKEITALLSVGAKVVYNRLAKIKNLLKNGPYH